MTDKQERIAEKIKKLLAIANDDAASAEEIQNAMNFAQRMMDAHHLTEEDLAHEPKDDYAKVDEAECGRTSSYVGKKVYYWESILASFVSKFTGCPCYVDNAIRIVRNARGVAQMDEKDNPKYGKSIVFYGVKEDTLIAAELYDELRGLIGSMAVIRYASVYKGDGASYSQGFVSGLFAQLKESKRVEKASGGTALILVARRDDLIRYKKDKAKNWLRESQGIKLRKSNGSGGTKTGGYEAFQEGKEDGRSTNVNATRSRKLGVG